MKTPTLLATAFAVALTSFAISTDAGAAKSLTTGRNATAAATVAKPARKSAAGTKAAKNEEPCPYLFGCPAKAKVAADAKTGKAKRVAKKATKSRSSKKSRHTTAARASAVDPVRTGSIAPSASTGAGPYGAIIARYAASYGVPVSLAKAVISIESNYRPHTIGSAGEVGLMQIKPATARMLGYSGSVKGLYDPETNIKYGMKYLAMAQGLGGGTTCGTILKYNAGHGARRMNPISAAYCSKVKVQMVALGSPA
jgi:soluble lytic murein transglycosylase-like protein